MLRLQEFPNEGKIKTEQNCPPKDMAKQEEPRKIFLKVRGHHV